MSERRELILMAKLAEDARLSRKVPQRFDRFVEGMVRSNRMNSNDSKKRIETQIPRRKQGRKTYPLESEWEVQKGSPPKQLRMPRENMGHDRRRSD